MEKMLQKIARQLEGLDEASLMSLWSKYAHITSHFEPTRRWEEACLIFSLIQAKRFKNQLFNYCWKRERNTDQPPQAPAPQPQAPFDILTHEPENAQAGACRVLRFTPDDD